MNRFISFYAAIDSGFDTAVHLCCALSVYALAVSPDVGTLFGVAGLTFLFASLGQTLLFTLLGVYESSCYRRFGAAYRAILRAEVLAHLTFPFLLAWLLGGNVMSSAGWILLSFGIDFAILLIKRGVLIRLRRHLFEHNAPRRILLVGDNLRAAFRFVRAQRENAKDGYTVVGFVGEELDEEVLALPRLGDEEALSRVLDEQKPHAVAFAIRSDSDPRFQKAVSLCDDRVIPVYLLPIVHDYFKTPKQIVPLCGENAIRVHYTPLEERWARCFKRCEDLVIGSVLLLLALPLMGAIALAIRWTDGRPVLFRQRRVGHRGREFTILKFRTMRDTPERDTAMTAREDPRRTRLGKLLRSTSLDELPQLINVIRGEMSLVGPRPEIPALVEKFKESIPLYMLKHYTKPGVTGLAQIRGLRGDTSIEERIREDLRYMGEWTPLLDLKILLLTPLRIINRQELRQKGKANKADSGDLSDKLRVLYVASTQEHLSRFHKPIIRYLQEEGCRVYTLSEAESSNFPLSFCKQFFSFKNVLCILQARKIVRQNEFDLIVLNTTLASVILRLALPKNKKITVVNFVHGYLFHTPPKGAKERLLFFMERRLRKRTDAVLVMNQEDKRIAEQYALGKTVFFTYGCGVTPFGHENADAYGTFCNNPKEKTPFTLAFVGELSRRKNQEFLLRAMVTLREYLPEARLLLIGDGAERDRLKKLCHRWRLSESVGFLGKRDHPEDSLREADLYVSASRFEGMPFNIVEAALFPLPILASDIKGHRDIVEKLPHSALYPADSIHDFVYHCLHFYYNPPAMQAEEARLRLENFLFDNATKKLFSVFREVINLCHYKKESNPFTQDGSTHSS